MTTAREIQTRLSECRFNPKTAGIMRVIASVQSPEYYETQATVLIEKAKAARIQAEAQAKRNQQEPEPFSHASVYDQYLIEAIQLLILARIAANEKFRTQT